jgi:tetratricopeptide (TPR) repeat protein
MKFPVLLAAALLLGACSSDKTDSPVMSASEKAAAASGSSAAATMKLPTYKRSRQRIDSLETKIREAVASPEKAPDVRLTMYMIQAYQYFAVDFPNDPRAAESLDRAGQLYEGVLSDHQRAAEYFEKAYQRYPEYPKRPQLLLQLAVACEEGGDTANAALAYKRLLSSYPKSPLAEQARGLLKLLRTPEAERQKMFGGQPTPAAAK